MVLAWPLAVTPTRCTAFTRIGACPISSLRPRPRHGSACRQGPGAKGERFYNWAAARLPAVTESGTNEPTRQKWVLARRSISRPDEIAYYLACAPLDATVADLVRVAGCRWKIEDSRARRMSAASTSTKSAATWAGTGTSRLPCSPTRSSR